MAFLYNSARINFSFIDPPIPRVRHYVHISHGPGSLIAAALPSLIFSQNCPSCVISYSRLSACLSEWAFFFITISPKFTVSLRALYLSLSLLYNFCCSRTTASGQRARFHRVKPPAASQTHDQLTQVAVCWNEPEGKGSLNAREAEILSLTIQPARASFVEIGFLRISLISYCCRSSSSSTRAGRISEPFPPIIPGRGEGRAIYNVWAEEMIRARSPSVRRREAAQSLVTRFQPKR